MDREALSSKSLIQFSVDGRGCVPSLLFDLRPNYGGGNEDNGDLLQKKVTCTQGLNEAKAGIKIARRNINNLRYSDDTTLMAESEEELKCLLRTVTEESEKVGLKLNIQKTKIMASSPNTSWQIDGETVETVTDLVLGGSKITADGDCSHAIKRNSLEGKL